MKATIRLPREVELTHVKIQVPVRYEEEDIPNDFPLRNGDVWEAMVEIDTGKILDWPPGRSGQMHMKVCDGGTYTIYDPGGEPILQIDGDYVPHGLIPGDCGDYIVLEIDPEGIITNWPKRPDIEAFLAEEE